MPRWCNAGQKSDASRVKDKYKTLREAYASFVATAHTIVSINKAHFENDQSLAVVVVRKMASPQALPAFTSQTNL